MLNALSRLVVRVFFREVILEGREHLPAQGPAIFAPNHPNALIDPLLLQFFSPPFPLRFVAKEPLFRIPLLGWILRQVRAIPVVRRLDVEGPVDYREFFAACVEALAAGDSIAIFPEGRSLPQPSMAPLRTGAARLALLARERGVALRIVPVGLNYEQGAVFRTSVVVSVAPPIDPAPYAARQESDPEGAVRALTEEVGRSLEHHVFQAETQRDRELMLLVERLYGEAERDDSWARRLARLKDFERGLARLRESCPEEIDRLRRVLARYEGLAASFRVREAALRPPKGGSGKLAMLGAGGLVIAYAGWALNWLPYRLCGWLVRLARHNAAGAATYKVVYSLFLFPVTYGLEAALVGRFWGGAAAAGFALLVIPLSYFTLRFFEWWEKVGAGAGVVSGWLGRGPSRRAARQLARLRERIVAEVDALAARPEVDSGAAPAAAPPGS